MNPESSGRSTRILTTSILFALLSGIGSSFAEDPLSLKRRREFSVVSERETEEILSVAYSGDGKLVGAGTAFGVIQIWSTDQGKEVDRLAVREQEDFVQAKKFGMVERLEIRCVSLSNTGDVVAFGTARSKRWQLAAGSGSFWMALSDQPEFAGLWRRDQRPLVQVCPGHNGPINDIVLSQAGNMMITASSDKTVRIWSTDSSKATATKPTTTLDGHSEAVQSLTATPDLSKIISGGWDRRIIVWDRTSASKKAVIEVPKEFKYAAVALAPDGKTVLGGGSEGIIRLYEVPSGELIRTFKGHSKSVNSLVFTPDGTEAISGGDDNAVIVWDIKSGNARAVSQEHKARVNSVAVSPDGNTALSGSEDKKMIMWQLPR